MFPLTRSLSLAAAGAIVALTAASIPARADELAQNLGPVGPREPILTWVGSKRVIAFYQPDSGNCAVHVVVWDPTDVNAESTAGLQATLSPRQMERISTPPKTSRFISSAVTMPSALPLSTPPRSLSLASRNSKAGR